MEQATSWLSVASPNEQCWRHWLSFGERLDSLTVRVEGSDSLSSTPSGASQTAKRYSTILTWHDKESGEDPSSLLDMVLVPISHYFLCNYRLMHLSIYAPLPPSWAKVGQTRGLDLIKCKVPHPLGKFSLQIPAPPPGLTQRIGLSACEMKIAIVYTYSAD